MSQTLALAEDVWSSMNHPNICAIWSLSSSTELMPAVAMPWFRNGNILDFVLQNPGVDKLDIVRLKNADDHFLLTIAVQVKQVANAVAYIHAMAEVHGNLIPVRL
jgi:hypothetical protein